MQDQLVKQTIDLAAGEITLLQPEGSAELPDDREIDWAPVAPYWSVLWRSGLALARDLSARALEERRVVELGCGLGAPSLAAATRGAMVLATDADRDAVELVGRNAELNGIDLETAVADWTDPDELIARGPFDMVLGADVLYERQSVAQLLSLLPRLARQALIADPGRSAADAFLEQARKRWTVETRRRGVVEIHRILFRR